MTFSPIEEPQHDPYLGLLSAAYQHQHTATIEILRSESGSKAIRSVMEDAQERARLHAGDALLINPPIQPLACGKGCHHCCWTTVGIVAPEAIHLADQLRDRLPTDDLAALTNRATRRGQRLQQMDRGERLDAQMACALLQDGSCSSYADRPLVCRWACSSSLQDCLDHLVHRTTPYLEMEGVRYLPTQEVWRGFRAGLRDSRLDASLLALNSALAIALSDPDIAQRYLDGEPVFAEARLG